MSNVITIPQLTRKCDYSQNIEDDDFNHSKIVNEAKELFATNTILNKKKSEVDPLEDVIYKTPQTDKSTNLEEYCYEVDDTPLPEGDGVLRLRMPLTREESNLRLSRKMLLLFGSSDIPDKKIMIPDESPPLHLGVSVHMGYQPITEEEAFRTPVSMHCLPECYFAIPRGRTSSVQIIDRIRNVVFRTDDINEIAPKNTHFSNPTQYTGLYNSTLIYTTFDEYENHRFARIHIQVTAIKDKDELFAISVYHIQGDSRISMSVFKTLRAYIESNGKTNPRVATPDFREGFSDQYQNILSYPTQEFTLYGDYE